jgi:hypothetical protein
MATRIQQFEESVNQLIKDRIRKKMSEPKMLIAEMNWNLETLGYTWDMTSHAIASGLEKQLIEKLEMQICKKKEALYLLTIGEKTESGCWITGKYKNYWLKQKFN